MCRSRSQRPPYGRDCPCKNNPIARKGVSIRQRISRYARNLDTAEQAGDEKKMNTWTRLFQKAMADYADYEDGPRPPAAPPHPEPPATRAAEFTLERTVDMSDEYLQQQWLACAHDPLARDAIEQVFEWRDQADARRDAEIAQERQRQEEAALQFLAARAEEGYTSVLNNPAYRTARKLTADQRCREEFDMYVESRLLAAEEECRGTMLTFEGQRKGIDARSFFSGNGQLLRRYGSPELKAWFNRNGRLSYQAFRYQYLNRDSDRQAAQRARIASYGDVAAA